MNLISKQGEPGAEIEVEMALPERWCPVCDQIRTPFVCARILPGGDDTKRCGTPTIHHEDLDPQTRERFSKRLRELTDRGAVNA